MLIGINNSVHKMSTTRSYHTGFFYTRPKAQFDAKKVFLHINTLTAGVAYIRVFIFYLHIKYHILNMLKIK